MVIVQFCLWQKCIITIEREKYVFKFFQMSPMVPAKRSESDIQDVLSDEDMEVEEEEEVLVDVPYTYEEEQVVDIEVTQEVPVQREVPQVKAAYAYTGQGMQVAKGEVRLL